MRIKWYEDEPGSTSSIRVMAMMAVASGIVTVGFGLVGFFMSIPESVLVIGAGSGIISLALGAKAWQSQAEGK